MTIRCQLRAVRRARNLTLAQVAAGTGIAVSTLSKMERNITIGYERTTLDRLCAFLECSVADLLVYEPEAEQGRDNVTQ